MPDSHSASANRSLKKEKKRRKLRRRGDTTREMRSGEKEKFFATTELGFLILTAFFAVRAGSSYLLSATDGLAPKSRRLFAAVRAARAAGWLCAAAP